jgi:Protein of unknown function (DUF2934)
MKRRSSQMCAHSATTEERVHHSGLELSIGNPHLHMKTNIRSAISEPTEQEIQHAAYILWIQSGRSEGHDLEHWLAAKEMLSHRHGRDAKTRVRAPEIAAPAPTGAPGSN